MINYFVSNANEILYKSLEHLFIASIALLLGILFAIPIGILITKNRAVAKIVMAFASVLQTIPSFALLSIITIIGVGKLPAIIALFIYSLLPILRNTYLGIVSVDKNSIDAARGMGMTEKQVLFKVKIPLALSVIMSGVRLSAVYVIAWTTLASYIGAGGLGDFIFNGLNNYIPPMIVWGTIPVSIMALFADFVLGKIEKKLSPYKVSGGAK
ncbi:ABC transporter permease [Peptoniphilus indolicus]|uniref:Glycine betaine/L-proline ABC superfamily ATP binding cassette transporter, membrane protein n=2 Tax=Peptoniphilus indolicus TaxID=33030 RepID=G4D2V0_9FIRM|nr:ABC transporter permease [Peptoniphilus indolicus]EGY80147.1 glycine betaine/L-proline ABC superfamily ATP binding cassette transporter, membrane protein [Peptoniphilus indolicus ATCC 29427]SUB75184.1 Putative osmoprotectant uptake system permease protein yehW [Peptoniphilus indolicus]